MRILSSGIAVLDTDSHISKWVESEGRLDHDQNLLPRVLQYLHPGDTVVDAGAFIGDHTYAYLNAVGGRGRVIAFEPQPEAFECLRYNCPQAISFNMGLGGKIAFKGVVKSVNAGASWLMDKGDTLVIPLDLVGLPRLDFFKVDVEGMEVELIQGAKETIRSHKPVILAEINIATLARQGTTPTALIDLVESLGYKATKVYESDTRDMPQYDLLFLPESLT